MATLNDSTYHTHSNGHSENSPNSSRMSVHSDEPLVRTQKQQTTQQVTTVTKVVREVQQIGEQSGEYIPVPLGSYPHSSHYSDYIDQPPHHMYSQYHQHPHYQVAQFNYNLGRGNGIIRCRILSITPIHLAPTWGIQQVLSDLHLPLVPASTVQILPLCPCPHSPIQLTWALDMMSFQNITGALFTIG